LLSLLASAALAAGGCGGEKRVDVKGTVTFNGEPLPEGQIRFVPTTEAMGHVSSTKIVNGAYECMKKNGLVVGKYRVEITGYRYRAGVRPDPNVPPWANKEQYLPEKYGRKTTIEFEVPGGSGALTKDFELTKQPSG
jgi:hypothetical protein